MEEPGFRQIVFRPNFIKDLNRAEASYESIQGMIEASWKQTSPGSFEYRISLPANTSGELRLPEGEMKVAPGDHVFHIQL